MIDVLYPREKEYNQIRPDQEPGFCAALGLFSTRHYTIEQHLHLLAAITTRWNRTIGPVNGR
jgi:hypothetical protein